MDQKQIGSFIAQLRKEKNLTQSQLGDILGVTNKTVSRWENGNYMPDIALLPELSRTLDVTINELICGRRIMDEKVFQATADANLLMTLEEGQQLRRKLSRADALVGAGTGILLSCVFSVDSPKRTVMLILGILLYIVGIAHRSALEKKLLRRLTGQQPPNL